MRIRCFMLEPTGRAQVRLRRYVDQDGDCSSVFGYHNASTAIGDVDEGTPSSCDGDSDPRWPTHCQCGYEFQPGDRRVITSSPLYRRSDNGELTTIAAAPPGAMWFAQWMLGFHRYHPIDGKILVVKTPGGDWVIDDEASNGGKGQRGWTRTGEPPNVTATPSIVVGDRYHGWLRDGWIEDV